MHRHRDGDRLLVPHDQQECRRILQYCLGGYMGVRRNQFRDHSDRHAVSTQIHRSRRHKAVGCLFESHAACDIAHVWEEGYNRFSRSDTRYNCYDW